jgi:hypothetical protein
MSKPRMAKRAQPNKIAFVEFPAHNVADLHRAKTFYSTVFGWRSPRTHARIWVHLRAICLITRKRCGPPCRASVTETPLARSSAVSSPYIPRPRYRRSGRLHANRSRTWEASDPRLQSRPGASVDVSRALC